MTRQERNAAVVGAGIGAFLLGVLFYLLGPWGLWVAVVVFLIAAGLALADDPDNP